MQLDGLVPRRVSDLLAEQMRTEPVIALHGPRSVGKSTVLRGFAEAAGGSVIDLDDVEVREAIQGNLAASVRAGAPICIDEYQRVPDILDALKARLNREGSPPGHGDHHGVDEAGRSAGDGTGADRSAPFARHLAALPRGTRGGAGEPARGARG